MIWRMQAARRQFSALVQRALDEGPQVVPRRGEAVVVVISAQGYARLAHPAPDFADFLRQAPDLDALDLNRARPGTSRRAMSFLLDHPDSPWRQGEHQPRISCDLIGGVLCCRQE